MSHRMRWNLTRTSIISTSNKRRFLLILLPILLWSQPTVAHGYIVRAIPEDRAVLEHTPTRLQYWFSEALETDFSQLNVRDQNGDIIVTGGVTQHDNTLMTVRLPTDLADGAYVVELRPAFASDGHVLAESRVFFIGETIGGVASTGATTRAVPLEVAWRTIVLVSTIVLFGTLLIYDRVLVPAWGNPRYPSGSLPPRVMHRLNLIVGISLLLAFAGNILALIQQTMTFFNIGFVQALQSNFWSLVRIGSRFGDIWNWRLLFLGVVGLLFLASFYVKKAYPQMVRAFWAANIWMTALILGTLSVLSHAAGSLLWPWLGMAVDWLHALGVGAWAGSLVALILVLPVALKPYQGDARRAVLLVALKRFSGLIVGAAFLVIATGIYNASNWFYTPSDLDTPFGGILAAKSILTLALLGFGMAHHIALRPERYACFQAISQRFDRFLPSLRLEALLVIVILVAVGILSATPVPTPEFSEQEIKAPTSVQIVDDLTIVLTLLPGGPGVNTYDTTVTRDGERVPNLDITLSKAHPASDRRGDWLPAEAVEPGLYVAAGDEIDEAGRWWTLMNMVLPDGHTTRIAFDWSISDEASVIESVDPRWGNLVALAGVVIAMGLVLYHPFRQLIAWMNFDFATIVVALGATGITLVALTGSYFFLQETRTEYANTLNPPPEVVNGVLPSQASLNRGLLFFQANCPTWGDSSDFDALVARLPRARDEELYYALLDGWRGLDACIQDLSYFQRWDVVNYLRSLERPI